ncbi:hypothetical protein QZM43_28270 [Burkholderia orbicola]|uniref:hypothetical protein n=1 Tax=Burkholderia orbicola TaxID=2978683 RepID=UPI002650850A|nr:hypothetical protein [Burkholderia orbicola]MDN7506635.1 hypothetical protein [Burkholderia orbicola]
MEALMREGARSAVEHEQDALFLKFASFAHATGCKSVFVFSARADSVADPRDFEFSERLFFYRVYSQEHRSFDLHLAGSCADGWFRWVAVKDEFDAHVVADTAAWLLDDRACHVTRVELSLCV